MNKKDFQLVVFFLDDSGKLIDSTWKGSSDQFEKASINYFNYLKNLNLPKKSITNSFTITLDSSLSAKPGWLSLCTDITSGKLGYTVYTKDDLTSSPDSCCECPPHCFGSSKSTLVEQAYKKAYGYTQ